MTWNVGWRYRRTALLVGVLSFMSIHVARLTISPLVPSIVDSFDVSYGSIGLVFTGISVTYALTQFPSGLLGDRLGERLVVLTSLGLTAGCSVLLALSPSYPFFLAVGVLLGVATGLYYPVATSLLVKLFEDTGRTIGVHQLGYPLAGLVAPLAASYLSLRYGWRTGLLLGAACCLPVLVAFRLRVRRPATAATATGDDRSLRERVAPSAVVGLLSRPPIAFTVFLAVVGSFVAQATVGFLPAFLVDHRGFSVERAGLAFSALFAVQALAQPLSGWLSDRFSRDSVTALAMALGVCGYLVLIVGDSTAVTVLAVGLVGLGGGWSTPVQSRFMDNLSADEQATGFGLVRTTYEILSSGGAVAMGVLVEVIGWTSAFAVLASLLAVGATAVGAVHART